MITRLPTIWVESPDDDGGPDPYIAFEVRDNWVSVDDDQLLLPIRLTERNGETRESPLVAILKQYGGEQLLNDILMSDQELEPGTAWIIGHDRDRGRYCNPLPTDDD